MGPVRLQEVANLAGVSRSTASRALRSDPQISAATRLKVRQAAEQKGYVPDPVISRWAAQAWKKRRSPHPGYELAYISPNNIHGKTKFLCARERAAELGYRVEFYSLRTIGSWRRINQVLRAKSIPGVLLNNWPLDVAMELDTRNLAMVCCGVGSREFPYHTVHLNTFRQMEMIWQKAMDRGRRKVFLWLQEPKESLHGRLHLGAALECERLFRPQMKITGTLFEKGDPAQLTQRILHSKCDVVVSLITNEVTSILAQLRQKGWKGEWLVLRSTPGCGLSGLKVHDREVVRESVNLLDRLIRDFAYGLPENPLTVLLTPIWNEETSPL